MSRPIVLETVDGRVRCEPYPLDPALENEALLLSSRAYLTLEDPTVPLEVKEQVREEHRVDTEPLRPGFWDHFRDGLVGGVVIGLGLATCCFPILYFRALWKATDLVTALVICGAITLAAIALGIVLTVICCVGAASERS